MKNCIRNQSLLLALLAWCLAATAPTDEPKAKPTADSMRGKEAGEVRDDNGLKMKLVWCLPGILTLQAKNVIILDAPTNGFTISARSDVASERAVIHRGYWMARYETTQREWKGLMNSEPWKANDHAPIKEGDDFPACYINWNDAVTFCARLTKQGREAGRLGTDWEYSLPTEGQWEHACRARSETQFCFGDDASGLAEYAWIGRDGLGATASAHEVGQKKPNAWGLFDVHGNLYEWTRDPPKGLLDVHGPVETAQLAGTQIIRGGGWNAWPEYCTSSHRVFADAERRSRAVGFRVALAPVQPAK